MLPDTAFILVLIHTVSTLFMTGLIWFVQVVHYPLKSSVGEDAFIDYQRLHMSKTGWVVGPPMLLEAFSALWLTLRPPSPLDGFTPIVGLCLLVFIWFSTAVFSVPAHNRLLLGFDHDSHRRLVKTNWLRTLGWSLRGLLSVYFLYLMINPTLTPC